MPDQAAALREMVRKQSPKPGVAGTGPGQLIAITSGKGGVGKTNVVVNLALALTRAKQRVAIFDADFGLANVDVVLGLAPTYHMGHVIEGILPLREIILEGPEGVHIIPASSGIQDLAVMSQAQRDELVFQLDQVLSSYDYIFIDTAAGISDNVIRFLMAAPRVVVVCAPEPTAIVDAYALIKVLFRRSPSKDVLVLVNLVEGRKEAENVFNQLARVVQRFLGRRIHLLGHVPRDDKVGKAVRRQEPLLISYPKSPGSLSFHRLAEDLQCNPFSLGEASPIWQEMI